MLTTYPTAAREWLLHSSQDADAATDAEFDDAVKIGELVAALTTYASTFMPMYDALFDACRTVDEERVVVSLVDWSCERLGPEAMQLYFADRKLSDKTREAVTRVIDQSVQIREGRRPAE